MKAENIEKFEDLISKIKKNKLIITETETHIKQIEEVDSDLISIKVDWGSSFQSTFRKEFVLKEFNYRLYILSNLKRKYELELLEL